jgi:tetratricopeptide (TPR) repeat protein
VRGARFAVKQSVGVRGLRRREGMRCILRTVSGGFTPMASTPQKQLIDALAAHRAGNLDRAEALYRAILRGQPKHFDATQLLGAVLHARGRNKEALALLKRAVTLNPNLAAVHNNLGNVVRALGEPVAALAHFDRALALDANYADAYNNRGNVLFDLGRLDEALADYERALALKPDHPNALQKSARVLAERGRGDEALARDRRAIQVAPPSADLFLRSGNVLLHLGRSDEALARYDQALTLDPRHKLAWIARGAALEALDRPDEALANFDRALAVLPRDADLLYNKATLLALTRRLDEACALHREALAVALDNAEAQTNYAIALLTKGDFAAGWPAYEHRWEQKGFGRRPALPEWRGEALEGRRVLVYTEQGLGDLVQFSRYLPLLQARGAMVTLLATRRMHALLRAAFPDVTLLGDVAEIDTARCDLQCALGSLPYCFGTRVETIPAEVPYLKAGPERVAHWREKIGTHGLRVGICWQGNPSFSVDVKRSMPLACFAPLVSVPGVRLISLQHKDGLDQLAHVSGVEAWDDFDTGPDAFADTMAAMECVDLVIAPDTSVAHVAGALARPVWVALRYAADWRWLLDRDDSPWYPTMRLFRQDTPGDWACVFARMRDELVKASS